MALADTHSRTASGEARGIRAGSAGTYTTCIQLTAAASTALSQDDWTLHKQEAAVLSFARCTHDILDAHVQLCALCDTYEAAKAVCQDVVQSLRNATGKYDAPVHVAKQVLGAGTKVAAVPGGGDGGGDRDASFAMHLALCLLQHVNNGLMRAVKRGGAQDMAIVQTCTVMYAALFDVLQAAVFCHHRHTDDITQEEGDAMQTATQLVQVVCNSRVGDKSVRRLCSSLVEVFVCFEGAPNGLAVAALKGVVGPLHPDVRASMRGSLLSKVAPALSERLLVASVTRRMMRHDTGCDVFKEAASVGNAVLMYKDVVDLCAVPAHPNGAHQQALLQAHHAMVHLAEEVSSGDLKGVCEPTHALENATAQAKAHIDAHHAEMDRFPSAHGVVASC